MTSLKALFLPTCRQMQPRTSLSKMKTGSFKFEVQVMLAYLLLQVTTTEVGTFSFPKQQSLHTSAFSLLGVDNVHFAKEQHMQFTLRLNIYATIFKQ